MGSNVIITNNFQNVKTEKGKPKLAKYSTHKGQCEINEYKMAKEILEKGMPRMQLLILDGTFMNKEQISEISRLARCSIETLTEIKLINIRFDELTKVQFKRVHILTYIGGSIEHKKHLADIIPNASTIIVERTDTICEAFRGLTSINTLTLIEMNEKIFDQRAFNKIDGIIELLSLKSLDFYGMGLSDKILSSMPLLVPNLIKMQIDGNKVSENFLNSFKRSSKQ